MQTDWKIKLSSVKNANKFFKKMSRIEALKLRSNFQSKTFKKLNQRTVWKNNRVKNKEITVWIKDKWSKRMTQNWFQRIFQNPIAATIQLKYHKNPHSNQNHRYLRLINHKLLKNSNQDKRTDQTLTKNHS